MLLWPAASLHEPFYPAHGPCGGSTSSLGVVCGSTGSFLGRAPFVFNVAPCSLQQEK